MLKPDEVTITMNEMKIMEMPGKNTSQMSVTLNEQGYFTVSTALLDQLKRMFPAMEMELRKSEDAKLILFKKPETYKFKLCKTGRFKYYEFMAELKKFGYKLPAKYSVAWNEGANAWVGVLQEVEKAPNVRNLARNDSARSKSLRGKSNEK